VEFIGSLGQMESSATELTGEEGSVHPLLSLSREHV
jgi:hypothetical protein